MKKLVIVGIGETAKLAYEYFSYDSDYNVVAFAADTAYIENGMKLSDLPVVDVNCLEGLYSPDEYSVFVAISGSHLNRNRTSVYKRIKDKGYKMASYISSRAFVWRNVEIGDNCFILENNTLQPFTKIGNNVTLWSGNFIAHSSTVEDNCFITSHVAVSGFCKIGTNTFIGVNSSIVDEAIVSEDNFIIMGSVITKNTEPDRVYRGNPAVEQKVTAKRYCKVEE